jgi:hypothetical protein
VEHAVQEKEEQAAAAFDLVLEIKEKEAAKATSEAVKEKEFEMGVSLASCGIVRDLDTGDDQEC